MVFLVPAVAGIQPVAFATPSHAHSTASAGSASSGYSALAWGPPALVYRFTPAPAHAVSSAAAVGSSEGTLSPVGGSATAPSSQASGSMGWTPMMHCSKMPRIMDMQNKG